MIVPSSRYTTLIHSTSFEEFLYLIETEMNMSVQVLSIDSDRNIYDMSSEKRLHNVVDALCLATECPVDSPASSIICFNGLSRRVHRAIQHVHCRQIDRRLLCDTKFSVCCVLSLYVIVGLVQCVTLSVVRI